MAASRSAAAQVLRVATGRPELGSILPSGPVILTVKLAKPILRPDHVARPDLVDRLRQAGGRRLTLLAAPLGFGKTSVLAEWVAVEQKEAIAWLSLDGDDNDPTRFSAYVIAALQTVSPHLGERALAAHRMPGADLISVVLPFLVDDLAGVDEPIALVLDDYHVITNPDIHEATSYLIEHLPERVRLVVSARSDPSLPLARLRARGDLVELRAGALRFTDDEAAGFLDHQFGVAFGSVDAQRLQARTEGWPAALYLAALSLLGAEDLSAAVDSFAADDRHILDYLQDEMLAQQPVALRRFMQRTSILDRFCAPLCDTVLQRDDSATILAELERSNLLLLPLDTKRVWYRYHQLLAELLQHELRRTEPQVVSRLHRRAGQWYEVNGMVVEAANHAIAAGDTRAAIELVAEHWSKFLDDGHLMTVSRWLAAVPAADISENRLLCFAAAMVASHGGSVEVAERWLDAGERAPMPPDDQMGLEVSSWALRGWLRLLRGDVDGTIAAARQAIDASPESEPQLSLAPRLPLGAALWWSQRLPEAAAVLRVAARTAERSGLDPQRIFAMGFESATAFDEHDFTRAQVLADDALRLTLRAGLQEHPFSAIARIVSGRGHARRGELGKALDEIERGIELANRVGAWHIAVYGLLAAAEVRELEHAPAAARRLIGRARAILEGLPHPGAGLARIELMEARLRLRRKESRDSAGLPFRELSERELIVLRRMTAPLSQREIAAELYISTNTVKTQIRAIFDKLGVASRAEAVARARELGLL